jgi:glycosyltransferase involved in cell wall biosynthesis
VTGVERVTEQTARSLATRHEVTVLSRRLTGAPPLPSLEPARSQEGVQVFTVVGGNSPANGPFPGHQARVEHIFERLLIEQVPDVVVIAHLIGHSPRYVGIAHRWHTPVVLELHDFYTVCERAHLQRPTGGLCEGPEGGRACHRHCFPHQDDGRLRWGLRTRLFREAIEQADALVAPSRFVARYFERYTTGNAPVEVIANGVTMEPAAATSRPQLRPLHIASLGPVIPHKGAHIVIEALKRAALPSARYTVFGAVDHQYMKGLRAAAIEIPGLEFKGYGPYELSMLPVLLADCDALVIPSIVWESFSIVAREALACGVPVLASRLGSLPEAVRDGENGMLFDARDPSELAGILVRIDCDRAALSRMRAAIRSDDWISVDERAHRLEELLGKVTAVHPDSARDTAADVDMDLVELRSLISS